MKKALLTPHFILLFNINKLMNINIFFINRERINYWLLFNQHLCITCVYPVKNQCLEGSNQGLCGADKDAVSGS